MEQEIYKMRLEHLAVPEIREQNNNNNGDDDDGSKSKAQRSQVKELRMTKTGKI